MGIVKSVFLCHSGRMTPYPTGVLIRRTDSQSNSTFVHYFLMNAGEMMSRLPHVQWDRSE